MTDEAMRRSRSQPRPHLRLRKHRARGIALVLVLAVIGLATILGVAMLASASLQAQVKSNNIHSAHAQYLAESGVSVAMYYLHDPAAAPLLVDGFYPGQASVPLRANAGDVVDISVQSVADKTYDITATGRAGPDDASISRQVKARVYVTSSYVLDRAASFAGNFTVPAAVTITGNTRCDGMLTNAGGTITGGSVQATASNISGCSPPPPFPTRAVPLPAQLNIVNTLSASPARYIYTDADGQQHTGYAQEIGSAVPINSLPPALKSNPLNVWYARDNDIWLADCDLNGTIVTLGSHKIVVAGNAHVRSAGKLPAIVALGGVRFCSDLPANALVVDGLVYCGADIDTTGDGEAYHCTTTINGALMMASTSAAISDKYNGTIDVSFAAANVDLPDLTSVDQTPLSVKVLRWGM
jgi:hypothetical protein